MATVFTKVINGEFPGHHVWRDDQVAAFMSIMPLKPGHVLVVPIEEVDHWIDMPADLSAHAFDVSRRIGIALNNAYQPTKVAQLVLGLEVPHAHIHLVPIDSESDVQFVNAAATTDEDLAAQAAKIRDALRQCGEGEFVVD